AAKGSQGQVPAPDELREMFSPMSWAGPAAGVFDAQLKRVLEGPRYATLWDHDRQLLELQRPSLERDKDGAAYQAVLQTAGKLVAERFVASLVEEPRLAGTLTWRDLADRWLAVANDTLIEVHRSDEFVEAQRRMLRSASGRHLQERKIAEAWCEAT